jgi:glycosyltransferase involved in cell wall biosynthesis
MKYSVVIAAKNEAKMLPACLESVAGAQEVIVVDDESSDGTPEIATKAGAKVFARKLDGFATQKNFGIEKASNDWVLVLDADERVSAELATAMAALPDAPAEAGFMFAFRNYLGRKWLKHGGLYPDYHTRLFDRRRARYEGRQVHEELVMKGEVGVLPGDVVHRTYRDASHYLAKVKRYSSTHAQEDVRLKRVSKQRRPMKAAAGEFVFRFFRLSGWKDGWAGFASAVLLGFYQYRYWREITK